MKQKNPSFDLLWNHLNTWGAIFVDCGFSFLFVGSNVNPVFSFKKSNLFEFFFFIKDVNLWRRSTDEYHESLATTNSNNGSSFKNLNIYMNKMRQNCFIVKNVIFAILNSVFFFYYIWTNYYQIWFYKKLKMIYFFYN